MHYKYYYYYAAVAAPWRAAAITSEMLLEQAQSISVLLNANAAMLCHQRGHCMNCGRKVRCAHYACMHG
jgi:hypothetical protein